ncbi:MAG TPA: cyclic nucleotide-binding domain-containing protein [Candidatus Binataceae bacterium]|nr:cyclic nucleotide-binding domain-containing protein [Candidatus Binataceae bacterium]
MQESTSPAAIREQLHAVPLFESLEEQDLQAVIAAGEIREAAPGEAITHEGRMERDFFVMLSGEAAVSVSDEDGAVQVGTIQAGEAFGELSAMLDEARTATVTASRRCRLLRLERGAIEGLFATNPRFALAFSRELARRLKETLRIENGLQLDQMPEKITLDAPDVTRLREYMVNYYATALRHIFKHHRLLVDRKFPEYETAFTVTPEEQGRWLALFRTHDTRTPFTYHTTVGTMMLMRLVGDVGVNFRNLMHLKSEMNISPEHAMKTGRNYRLVSAIEDIIALREDRVALVCASRVYDDQGVQVRGYRDFFIILNLDPEYIEALRSIRSYGRRDPAEFHGLANREARLGNSSANRVKIEVPEGMGFEYGKVSGDLNLVHTTRLAAKLFGHPRPFVQGLCTANYALRYLTEASGPPENLRITFAKRVFVGQQVEFVHTDREFELWDSTGALLAFGEYDAAPRVDR